MIPHASRTLVVMPAFNEEECVGDVVREVQQHLPGVSILVVDDGSVDNTAEVAQTAGATVASLPFNLGVGGAMRFGFKYAVMNGYECVVQIDSDGQHDPQTVSQLIAKLDEYDLVLGARFAGTGDYVVKGPRSWAMRFLAFTLSRVCKTPLTDTTSGLRASGPAAIELFAENYPAEYLGDTIEALVIAAKNGLRITQVPVAMRARAGGEPSNNPVKAAIHLGRASTAVFFSLMRPASVSRKTTDEPS